VFSVDEQPAVQRLRPTDDIFEAFRIVEEFLSNAPINLMVDGGG